MTFLDRVRAHPDVFVLGCLVWVPVAIWVISFIHWAIQGDIDVITMIIGIGAAFALGYFTAQPPDPRLSVYLFSVSVGAIVAFPIVRSKVAKRALAAMEIEQAERAYDILRQSPDNIGARMKLARVLFVQGLIGHAVSLGETTLRGLPRGPFRDDIVEVERWRLQARDPRMFADFACLNCGTMNRVGEVYCRKCHARLMLDLLKGSWRQGGFGRKLIAAWILGILVFVGIPSCAMLRPPGLAIGLIAGQVVLGALAAWVGVRERAS